MEPIVRFLGEQSKLSKPSKMPHYKSFDEEDVQANFRPLLEEMMGHARSKFLPGESYLTRAAKGHSNTTTAILKYVDRQVPQHLVRLFSLSRGRGENIKGGGGERKGVACINIDRKSRGATENGKKMTEDNLDFRSPLSLLFLLSGLPVTRAEAHSTVTSYYISLLNWVLILFRGPRNWALRSSILTG